MKTLEDLFSDFKKMSTDYQKLVKDTPRIAGQVAVRCTREGFAKKNQGLIVKKGLAFFDQAIK